MAAFQILSEWMNIVAIKTALGFFIVLLNISLSLLFNNIFSFGFLLKLVIPDFIHCSYKRFLFVLFFFFSMGNTKYSHVRNIWFAWVKFFSSSYYIFGYDSPLQQYLCAHAIEILSNSLALQTNWNSCNLILLEINLIHTCNLKIQPNI